MTQRITVSLTGGLGNQMFQYAAGRALSNRLSLPLAIDISWFRRRFNPKTNTSRRYELDCFPIPLSQTVLKGLALPTPIQVFLSSIRGERLVNDSGTTPDDFELLQSTSIRLTGYWQDERYFKNNFDMIRSDFNLSESSEYQSVAKEHGSGMRLGIHIRRGDYVQTATRPQKLTALPLDYYQTAIDLMQSRHLISKIVIVSDDPSWCRSHFLGEEFEFSPQMRPFSDLVLLNSCDHIIISNSTFSWWAAWLKCGENHSIIAPQRWFTDGSEFNSLPTKWDLI